MLKPIMKNVRKKQRAFVANPTLAQGWELALTLGPALVVIALAFFLAMRFMPPPPPKQVVITTGGETGGYFAFGKRYAEILGRNGVSLIVQTSAGSIENLQRLREPDPKVQIGVLQGGIGNSTLAPNLRSIGRIFHEPLWIFYRGPSTDRLADLAGKRIAVAGPGSGTRALVDEILRAARITSANATLVPITGQPAVAALRKGEIDVVFLALAPQAPLIQELVKDPTIRLMSLAQSEALTKMFPYLARLTLPQGVFDIAGNIPDRDISMVAPQAALVVDQNLHPAIIALLAEAAQEVHGKASLFARAGEFPTLSDPEFEMDPDALRYYKSGPTFWKRIFPYWIANLVERAIVFLVPLLTVLIPLVKVLPALYKWRFRQRLLHWYSHLKEVEDNVTDIEPGPEAVAEATDLHRQLDHIDESVGRLPVPIQFAEQFYNLRTHLDLVRERLKAKVPAALTA
jgi:TRAP transporter TAXI family solute receptor